MRIQEQISQLKKIHGLLVRSKQKRLENGSMSEMELNYQIDSCKCAINSLERLLKLREQLQQASDTLKQFDFEMIQ